MQEQHWLDAYLLSVALLQTAQDGAPRPVQLLRRGASALGGRRDGRPGLETGARWTVEAAERLGGGPRPGRRAALAGLARLIDATASRVVDPEAPAPGSPLTAADGVSASISALGRAHPRAMEEIMRIPSCFKSFDQRIEDLASLADRFLRSVDVGDRPIVVVGVRTSGSYLAPLLATLLRERTGTRVQWETIRPYWPIPPASRTALKETVGGHSGLCLLVDDPPTSGQALEASLAQLERLGAPRQRTFALLATFPSSSRGLSRLRARATLVELPWSEWHINCRLEPALVRQELATWLLPDHRIAEVVRAATRQTPYRGHASALYRVVVVAPDGGEVAEEVVAEGVGIGFFGRHAAAVAAAAPELFPEVLGVRDGVLYRLAAAGEGALGREAGDAIPGRLTPGSIAEHLAVRSERLTAARDSSIELRGRQAVWEVATDLVSRVGGALSMPLRAFPAEPLVRTLLESDQPAIIDGNTACPALWYDGAPAACKVGFSEGAFSNHDLACYDPWFDVAGVAHGVNDDQFTREVRRAFALRSGRSIDPERWLLYLWVQAWNSLRLGRMGPVAWSRRAASSAQQYFAERFLEDLPPALEGPWAALDIDGVLETSPMGFPALTRAGACALRALRAHGWPLVLVTGRSLPEVVERCQNYGAVGGVAEYGTVVYDHRRRSVHEVVPVAPEVRSAVRSAAEDLGLEVDPDYERILRVSRRGPGGARRGITSLEIDALLGVGRGGLVAIPGEEQTDLVPGAADKASGLERLRALMAGGGSLQELAFAIGDAPSDEPFLRLAARSFVPANGSPALSAGGHTRTRRAYQAGLAEAVGTLVGHRPGSCPLCASPPVDRSADALLGLLSLREDHWRGVPARLARTVANWATGRSGAPIRPARPR